MWHETRDAACKTEVKWVTETVRRVAQRKALEKSETKISNCEVTLPAFWPVANSVMKRDGPKAPSAIHGIKQIVFLDFIHRLVSQEQTELRKLKIIDKRTQYTRPQTNHTRINY
jgi:hypothetical protein